MKPAALLFPLIALLLPGCIAATAAAIIAVPVKVAGSAISTGIDAATTTQSEVDEDRGKAERKAEEKAAKERKQAEMASRTAQAEQAKADSERAKAESERASKDAERASNESERAKAEEQALKTRDADEAAAEKRREEAYKDVAPPPQALN